MSIAPPPSVIPVLFYLLHITEIPCVWVQEAIGLPNPLKSENRWRCCLARGGRWWYWFSLLSTDNIWCWFRGILERNAWVFSGERSMILAPLPLNWFMWSIINCDWSWCREIRPMCRFKCSQKPTVPVSHSTTPIHFHRVLIKPFILKNHS